MTLEIDAIIESFSGWRGDVLARVRRLIYLVHPDKNAFKVLIRAAVELNASA